MAKTLCRFILLAHLWVSPLQPGLHGQSQPASPPLLAAIENDPDLVPLTPVVEPPANTPLAGSNSVTAALTQGEALVAGALDNAYQSQTRNTAGGEKGSFGYYFGQYQHFNSTPYLYVMGLPLGVVLETVYFKQTIWALAVLFVAASTASKMKSARADFADFYSDLIIRVMVGGLLLSQPGMIYAAGAVLMNSGADGIKKISDLARAQTGGVGQRLATVLSHAGTGDIELREARDRGIRAGLASRQAVFTRYAHSPALDSASLDYWAAFYNALSAAQRAGTPAGRSYDPVPRVGQANLDDVRRKVVTRYVELTFDSANIDPDFRTRTNFSLDWQFEQWRSTRTQFSVGPLGNQIKSYAGRVAEAFAKTGTSPSGQQQKLDLLDQYEKGVRDITSKWLADEFIGNFNSTMNEAGDLAGAFADLRTMAGRGALAATKVLSLDTWATLLAKGLSLSVTILQKTVIPLIATVIPMVLNLFLELSLLGLMIATPFWFFDGTRKAFTGALETMGACCLMLPFWHFFQLILDLLFATITYLLSYGGIVAGGAAAVSGVGLAALGGYAVIVTSALTIGYVVSSLILVFKTPSLVKSFLSGAGWVTGIVMVAAKGMIAAAGVAAIGSSAFGQGLAGASGPAGAAGLSGTRARGLASGGTIPVRRPIRAAISAMGRAAIDIAAHEGSALPAAGHYYNAARRNARPAAAVDPVQAPPQGRAAAAAGGPADRT